MVQYFLIQTMTNTVAWSHLQSICQYRTQTEGGLENVAKDSMNVGLYIDHIGEEEKLIHWSVCLYHRQVRNNSQMELVW